MRFLHSALLALPLLVAGCGSSRPSTGTIAVAGVPLRYVREGQGPTTAIIGSGVYYPKAYSSELRKHLDMIFVDLRYDVAAYQPTTEELAGITFDTFADDLDVVRGALGVERWAVIGHSINAQTAIAYARKYPQHTSHLVIIAGVPFRPSDYRAEAASFFEADASHDRKAALAKATEQLDSILAATPLARRFAVTYNSRAALYWADPRYDATRLLEGFEPSQPALDRLPEVVPAREQVREALQQIKVPILLVLGKLDYAIPYFTWQPLIEGMPNISYHLLESDSHNPMTEAPERFDPILTSWLTKQ